LIYGGARNGQALLDATLYDPAAKSFAFTSGNLQSRHDTFTNSTLLKTGKVLVTGGDGVQGLTAELYDPPSKTFALTASMLTDESNPNATAELYTQTVLTDGRVLVAGCTAREQIYDPIVMPAGWTKTSGPSSRLPSLRCLANSALLPNGKVLIAGGTSNFFDSLATAVEFDPANNTFAATANNMTQGRRVPQMVLLNNGKVLVFGGQAASAGANLYDPANRSFAATGSLKVARAMPSAARLNSGKVLVAGGQDAQGNPLQTAELYDPATAQFALIKSGGQNVLMTKKRGGAPALPVI
ncbi:MAG: Kelch repeat-containing protein, partial [Candidatus Binataceae bacterium]